MDLINFIKNLFKQKEDNLLVDQKSNSKLSVTDVKYVNRILDVNTLTGEIIIK